MKKKKRVLLVDDHPKVLRFVEIDLKLRGFEVVTTTSGEEALELVKSAEPDIMLLDIIMPGMVIFHQREPRDLAAAYRKYCGGEMENAHRAEEDAKASAKVLDGQLEAYQDLPRDASGLCALCYEGGENYVDAEGKFIWVEGETVCNFGKKHKGRKLKDISFEDPSYLEWITRSDFSIKVKEIALKAINGEFPEPPELLQLTQDDI